MIRQLWLNLISNAIKYSSKKPERIIEIESKTEGDEIIYSLKDNGAGFNMEHSSKLFGVFQRLHTAKEFDGIGIGLAIVNRIVNRHKGRIWAEGKVGEGAAFFFTIGKRSQ
jgi:light-regulated signal transduction histidine kinase (bacteriophytochrome)